MSRRHFLTGAGAALALPTLTSLTPKSALADLVTQKSFIGIGLRNGLYRMYGPTSQLMPQTPEANNTLVGFQTLQGPHTIHYHDSLTALAASNGGNISDIVDASFAPMLKKMLMLQGFDYLAIGETHHLGHFGSWQTAAGNLHANPPMASLDVVISDFFRSKGLGSDLVSFGSLYGDKDNALSFNADGTRTTSYFWSPAQLWDKYFGATTVSGDFRTLIVDKVLDDYRSLRAHPRLGADDKQRLDAHIAHLAATEAKLQHLSATCQQRQQARPTETYADLLSLHQSMNDVIVGLISCGMCNIFTHGGAGLVASNGDEAHGWSHSAYSSDTDSFANPTIYSKHLEQHRQSMKILALDLAQKLDALGLLDNSLIAVIQEHSKRGHQAWNVPVITFGSAGGVLKTDQYVDFRNIEFQGCQGGPCNDLASTRWGYPMNQLYATVLRAMGMQPSDFEPLNKTRSDVIAPFKANSGYGIPGVDSDYAPYGHYGGAQWNGYDMSAWLPRVAA